MRNWAGNYEYRARRLLQPRTVEEVQEMVRSVEHLRVLGSRHSFNAIADTTWDHLSLARMRRSFRVDPVARTVRVDGATRYGELCERLDEEGFALGAMASLPHISVAGAVATATHGSGDRSRSLAAAVRAFDVVTADGSLGTFGREADGEVFEGAVVSLGALGVVTTVTLDVEPAYRMRQDVYDDLPLETFVNRFDDVTDSADSTSFFTTWQRGSFHQVWLKRRVEDGSGEAPAELFGAPRATAPRHPIPDKDPRACTTQLGVAGPWHERLPHFRLDHTPSSGDELQSEYVVARADLVAAVRELWTLADRLAPLVQVSEIRTIAGDDQWLSPAGGRPSAAIHFTWEPRWDEVRALLPEIEAILEPFAPRPHWAKLFTLSPAAVRGRYPRIEEFVSLARRRDPEGKFVNEFLATYVFGGSAPAA